MAQLRDSVIDGNLEVTGNIVFKTNEKGVQAVHPETGEINRMIHMSEYGNTIIGYDGYANQNGNTHVYGNDISHYVGSADINYRPYYRAGDVINFAVRTSGYVSNGGLMLIFTIPITKPVIGSPSAIVSSDNGFILRQNGNYTHGSGVGVYVKPTSYSVHQNYNSGFIVTANFDVATDVINNSPIGVYWDGTITLS